MQNKTLNIGQKTANIIRFLCAAVLAAMLITAITVYGMSLPYTLIMAAFLIFYVQLPGLFMIDRMGIKCDHISTALTLSVFDG